MAEIFIPKSGVPLNTSGGNFATPQTGGIIQQQSGPGFAPTFVPKSGIILNQSQQTVQPQQPPQPTTPVYTGQVEQGSPITTGQRAALSFGDEEGKKQFLTNLGYTPLNDSTGHLAYVQKDNKTYKIDEDSFNLLKDTADLLGKALPLGGSIIGSIGGTLAGIAGGPVGAVAGGAVGGGLGGGAGETLRQGIGSMLGVNAPGGAGGEIMKEAAFGTVAGALAPVGGALLGRIAPQIGTELALDAAGNLVEKGAMRSLAGSVLSPAARTGLTLGTEAVGAGLQGGTMAAGQTAAQGGSLSETVKAFGEGFVAGAPFGPLGYAVMKPVAPYLEKGLSNVAGKIGEWIPETGQYTQFFKPIKNALEAAGEIGKTAKLQGEEIVYETDRLTGNAIKTFQTADKYIKSEGMTPEEVNQAITIAQANNRISRGTLGVAPVEEVLAQTTNPKVRQLLEYWYQGTREISQSIIDAGGTIRTKAGEVITPQEPSVFFPIRPQTSVMNVKGFAKQILEEPKYQTIAKIDPKLALEEATAAAEKRIKAIQGVTSGKAREKTYLNVEMMKASGVETDPNAAFSKWVRSMAKKAAIMKVYAKEITVPTTTPEVPVTKGIKEPGKPVVTTAEGFKPITLKPSELSELSDIESKTGEQITTSLLHKHRQQIYNAIDKTYDTKVADVWKKYVDVYYDILDGKQFTGNWTRLLKQLQGGKLSLSFIKNLTQPLNNALQTDLPVFGRALGGSVRALLGGDGLSTTLRERLGGMNAKELLAQSGSMNIKLLDTDAENFIQKILDVGLKPLTWTERFNRLSSAISGAEQALAYEKVINSGKGNVEFATNKLKELLGGDIPLQDGQVFLSKDNLFRSAYNMTKYTQFGYDPLMMPGVVSTSNMGALAGQFKSYSYNQARLVLNSTIGEFRSGNFGRGTRNFLLLSTLFPPSMAAANSLISLFTGAPSKDDLSNVQGWMTALATGGTLGLWMDMARANTPEQFIANLAGPGVGMGAEAIYAAIDAVKGKGLGSAYDLLIHSFGGLGKGVKNIIKGEYQAPEIPEWLSQAPNLGGTAYASEIPSENQNILPGLTSEESTQAEQQSPLLVKLVRFLLQKLGPQTVEVNNQQPTEQPLSVTPKTMPLKPSTPENTVAGYNLDGYASDQKAIPAIKSFYDSYKNFDFNDPIVVQNEIDRLMKVNNQTQPPVSPITGEMIVNAAKKYGIDPKILFSLIRKESSMGLNMPSPNNPANVLNTDVKDFSDYQSMEGGIDAGARELARRKVLLAQNK